MYFSKPSQALIAILSLLFVPVSAGMAQTLQSQRAHTDSSAPAAGTQFDSSRRIKRVGAAEPTNSASPINSVNPSNLSQSTHRAEVSSTGPGAGFLQKGKAFARHGAYRDAANFFTRAAEADPKNPEPYNRRARAEWQLEQLKDALEDANYAIKLNPDYAEAFCTRAAIYNSMAHYQDAVADASMARDLNKNLRDAYMLEASAYHNLNQHREGDALVAQANTIQEPQPAFDEWQPNIDWGPYYQYLQSTVRGHYSPPAGAFGTAVPIFKIHRSGEVTELRMGSLSGSPEADNAALDAVKRSAPFQQPPAGSPPDFDAYVVLDNQNGRPAPPPAEPSSPPPQSAPSGGSSFNWGNTLNQGVNQGFSIMNRFRWH